MTLINKIVEKMKSLQVDEDDFFIKTFTEIENDKNLSLAYEGKKENFQKIIDGTFKCFKDFYNKKQKPTQSDLTCQKYIYECEIEPNITYNVLKIFKTTDENLKQFEGKAFIQRVDEDHQIITVPEDVIEYMKSKLKLKKMNFTLFGNEINL